MQITLDRGFRSYELVDTDGNQLGILRFNPSDPGFAGRWQALADQGQKLAVHPPQDPAGLDQADRVLKKLLDDLFAAPVSEVLFGGLSCFALCRDGVFVFEHVIEAVQPVILEALESASKATEARITARTAKYEHSAEGLAPGQAEGAAGAGDTP